MRVAALNKFIRTYNKTHRKSFSTPSKATRVEDAEATDYIATDEVTGETILLQETQENTKPWGPLARTKEYSWSGSIEEGTDRIFESIKRKNNQYDPETSKNLILLLEGWASTDKRNIKDLLSRHGEEIQNFYFPEIWLVKDYDSPGISIYRIK